MRNPPIIPNAVLLDRVIGEIQVGLSSLSWLDAVFGRAQRLTRIVGTKKIISPNVYCGGWNGHGSNDYIEVSPDSKIGNFAFFITDDPQMIDGEPWAREYTCPFALIVWVNLNTIYNAPTDRNVEYLKAQVLRVLSGRTGWYLSQGSIRTAKIYEQVENIYRGFTLSEIDNQFLMHPYAGFRIEGTLKFAELCFSD